MLFKANYANTASNNRAKYSKIAWKCIKTFQISTFCTCKKGLFITLIQNFASEYISNAQNPIQFRGNLLPKAYQTSWKCSNLENSAILQVVASFFEVRFHPNFVVGCCQLLPLRPKFFYLELHTNTCLILLALYTYLPLLRASSYPPLILEQTTWAR